MKFLCLCHYGHSRSVALCRVLHARGHEAVPVGVGTSPSAIPRLCLWADKVVCLQEGFAKHVPPGFAGKVVIMDVGPDRWSNPYNQDLQKVLGKMCDEQGWL
jgi:hypothetical protein